MKAIIFDLDNTLMDFMRLKKASCEEAISAMVDSGLRMDKDKALKILFDMYEVYGIEDKEIFQKFLKKTAGRIDYRILANGIVAYRRVKNSYLAPYPGVTSTLLKLKQQGIKLAIVSDAPRLRAWTRLAALRLTDYFDAVVTFDDTKKYKPHPAPFRKALSKLKVKPRETVVVGDWPARDMEGAKKLGMKSCFAKYGAVRRFEHVNSDYIIENIRELLDIVDNEDD
ncbi:TIGR02253 family HAD-type hydrolase [Candidatus Woesearchaeota archaeon]|nr:TIGR02253 family HAD-type hydrolase [Candidatus Woesearchaeota archaeon]